MDPPRERASVTNLQHLWAHQAATAAARGIPPGRSTISTASHSDPAGFQNLATCPDLGSYAAGSYSLMRPPRTGRRWIRSRESPRQGCRGIFRALRSRRMADALTRWPSLSSSPLDPPVSPAVVLGGEPLDQRDDLGADRRPPYP